MKVAVCLHGLARGSTVSAGGAYQDKFKKLLDLVNKPEIDIFIHSWDVDIAEELNKTFKPKASKYEEQKSFTEEMKKYDANFSGYKIGAGQGNLFKTLSFLYSRQQSLLLKEGEYDSVLIARFDVGYHNNGRNKTSYLPSSPDFWLFTDKINQAYWDQTDAGASDHWFYTNNKDANYLGTLYDKLPEYLDKDSEYAKACRNGWPLSCRHNEFSGQIFKEEESSEPHVYRSDNSVLINNHCLYKWHIMQANKWNSNDCKFWNKEMWE